MEVKHTHRRRRITSCAWPDHVIYACPYMVYVPRTHSRTHAHFSFAFVRFFRRVCQFSGVVLTFLGFTRNRTKAFWHSLNNTPHDDGSETLKLWGFKVVPNIQINSRFLKAHLPYCRSWSLVLSIVKSLSIFICCLGSFRQHWRHVGTRNSRSRISAAGICSSCCRLATASTASVFYVPLLNAHSFAHYSLCQIFTKAPQLASSLLLSMLIYILIFHSLQWFQCPSRIMGRYKK